ncbi:DUF2092 domain-containing protein [Variovorax saccharolyticus]|uniref:DUF2092 domain-containing protein n=1 Tax=Variovorax saccharolyticus TaxID=3053516 RepID=UPI002575EBEA|nr:DUF2092 domain-containing protein [Variovorax sp. J22R187]MDM0021170.1 DUF2092 domain-containing protein [Variovorax sp. J22R187]
MALTAKRIGQRVGLALLAAAALLGAGSAALAQDTKAAPAAAPAKDFKDERALALLKAMGDTLAGARTLSFKVRGIVPTPSPTGQYVSLFAASRVVMQRPDKLFVEARGDLFPSDSYYDGKTVTVIGADRKFYARREAAGGAIEALMQSVQPGSDATAPFLDLLVADPYAFLTKDLASALWVGQSTIGGVKTEHLAFTAPGLDWEIWIGAADKLPRLMVVAYRSSERQPTFTVEFSEWKLNATVPAKTFVAAIPPGAAKLEFKQMGAPK